MRTLNHGAYVDARDVTHCEAPGCPADTHSIDFLAGPVTVRVKTGKAGGVQIFVYLNGVTLPVVGLDGLQLAPREV